jgi:hypothetical protein
VLRWLWRWHVRSLCHKIGGVTDSHHGGHRRSYRRQGTYEDINLLDREQNFLRRKIADRREDCVSVSNKQPGRYQHHLHARDVYLVLVVGVFAQEPVGNGGAVPGIVATSLSS